MSRYEVTCENTGDTVHSMIIAASIWKSADSGGNFVMDLPWFVIKNTEPGFIATVEIELGNLGLPAGSYTAMCRAATSYSAGTVEDMDTINSHDLIVYRAGTGGVYGTYDFTADDFSVGQGVGGMRIIDFDMVI